MPKHYLLGDSTYPETNAPAVEHGRLVAVLDPENREQVERLLSSLQRMSFAEHARGAFTCLQAALREFANPSPRIEEPTKRGAVVKDSTGLAWVRVHPGGEAWVNGYQRWASWDAIDAVEVVRS